MPLNAKGRKIKAAMVKQYGSKKGKRVFYASENKGTISGVTEGKASHSKAKPTKARKVTKTTRKRTRK